MNLWMRRRNISIFFFASLKTFPHPLLLSALPVKCPHDFWQALIGGLYDTTRYYKKLKKP